jgi:multidrug efflux system membrane fusion protein
MKIKLTLWSLLMPLFVIACRDNNGKIETAKPVPVRVYEVVSGRYPVIIHSSGRLSTSREQKLSFKTGGIIREIMVNEGQSVRKEDVLARLDLSEIGPQVDQAREAFEKAERDYDRAVNLYHDSVATLEQLQNALTLLQISRSNFDIASFNLRHSTIVAPSKGRILKKLMEENEMAGSGYPVFLFGSTEGNWIVRINVTDRDRVRLHNGDTAVIKLDAFPGEIFRAEVSELSNAADPYTGTFEVELMLKTQGRHTLLTGMIARAEIYADRGEMVSVVPVEAIMKGSGNTAHIYEVVNGLPVKRDITILEIRKEDVLVSADLKAGSLVITDNLNALSDSTAIIISSH